jgi:hypothetical protein
VTGRVSAVRSQAQIQSRPSPGQTMDGIITLDQARKCVGVSDRRRKNHSIELVLLRRRRCLRTRPTPSWPSLLGRTTTVARPALALVELSPCAPSGSSRDRVGQMFRPVPNQDRFAMVNRKRASEPALTAMRWKSCPFAIPTPIGCSLLHVANMAQHLECSRLVSFRVSFPLHS